jgi:phospholipase A-2-activating protein
MLMIQLVAKGFAGNLQVGQVQSAKSLFKARASKLGEKRLVDLAAELERLGA